MGEGLSLLRGSGGDQGLDLALAAGELVALAARDDVVGATTLVDSWAGRGLWGQMVDLMCSELIEQGGGKSPARGVAGLARVLAQEEDHDVLGVGRLGELYQAVAGVRDAGGAELLAHLVGLRVESEACRVRIGFEELVALQDASVVMPYGALARELVGVCLADPELGALACETLAPVGRRSWERMSAEMADLAGWLLGTLERGGVGRVVLETAWGSRNLAVLADIYGQRVASRMERVEALFVLSSLVAGVAAWRGLSAQQVLDRALESRPLEVWPADGNSEVAPGVARTLFTALDREDRLESKRRLALAVLLVSDLSEVRGAWRGFERMFTVVVRKESAASRLGPMAVLGRIPAELDLVRARVVGELARHDAGWASHAARTLVLESQGTGSEDARWFAQMAEWLGDALRAVLDAEGEDEVLAMVSAAGW